VVKYKLETKSAVKGAIILVIVLFWKEAMEQGARWIASWIKERYANPLIAPLLIITVVTVIGVSILNTPFLQ
jgi:hypothetical protein